MKHRTKPNNGLQRTRNDVELYRQRRARRRSQALCCCPDAMRFDMKKLLFSLFLIFPWQACGHRLAQSPREGYIRTSDGVRLFYKIDGSGSDVLVAVHG